MRQYAHMAPDVVARRAARAAIEESGTPNLRSGAFYKASLDDSFRRTFRALVAELRSGALGFSRKVAQEAAWASMFRCKACGDWTRPNKDPDWDNIRRRPDGGLDHVDCVFARPVEGLKAAQKRLDSYQQSTSRLPVIRGDRLA